MSTPPITVLIVDDHAVVRQGLRALLLTAEGIEVVGEATDGREAIAEVERLNPDVTLMDVVLPHIDGPAAIRAILQRDPEARIVALSGYDIDERILGALRAGALGYLSKSSSREALLEAIRQVARGRASLPADLTRRLLTHLKPQTPNEALSDREVEILRQISKGLSNRQTAEQLNISEGTVRTHVSNILAKLGAENRVEATLFALRDGLTTLDECLAS
jgi:two-component system, NarL family, response regulator LiaR